MRSRIKKAALLFCGIFTIYIALIYAVALLPHEKLIGNRCLPDNLKHLAHDDYISGLRGVPRSITSACFVEPPVLVLGNEKASAQTLDGKVGPHPLPDPGEWELAFVQEKKHWPIYIPYFAITTKNGWHFRLGCRWDHVDHYFTFVSLAAKKLNPKK